jgi:hypothetical protein
MTPSFVVGAAVQYVLLPLVLLGLITAWVLRGWRFPRLVPWLRSPWALMTLFVVIGGGMATLRYLAYRTAYHDLGIYDQRFWSLSQRGILASFAGFMIFGPVPPEARPAARGAPR